MSVIIDEKFKKLMSKVNRKVLNNPELCRLGLAAQAIEMKFDYLLSNDSDYQAEKKELNERYSKELNTIKEKYAQRYIDAGLF
jgi:hypothetical protein